MRLLVIGWFVGEATSTLLVSSTSAFLRGLSGLLSQSSFVGSI